MPAQAAGNNGQEHDSGAVKNGELQRAEQQHGASTGRDRERRAQGGRHVVPAVRIRTHEHAG